MSDAPAEHGPVRRRLATLSVGRLLGVTIGVLLALAAAGIGAALVASYRLGDERELLLSDVAPANRAALALESALVNEETGIRGYLITDQPSFLAPYREGLRGESDAYVTLESHQHRVGAPVPAEIAQVRAAALAWQLGFAAHALAEPRRIVERGLSPDARGKFLFDEVRARLAALQGTLAVKDASARAAVNHAADVLDALLIFAAVLVLGSLAGAGLLLRRAVTQPLARLGEDARRVSGGEFQTPMRTPAGPREVRELAGEIEGMRGRIVQELASVEAARAQLEEQALELSRSNADLEQFAYVASHDLQEPLRKVASFCQALQVRYEGQLDDRADQYIEFAVDGAKRMQALINDLLAFSRVGRSAREQERVELSETVAAARAALAASLEETGGSVRSGELPAVMGDPALLRSLFQNLIANALKFRGEQPPAVMIEAVRDDGWWVIGCADNGIGIDPEYAERIFLIFQRLHPRDVYGGSGIGLALCRRIVEYHGGRIWLDTGYHPGARFRFTLPAMHEDS